MKKLIIFIAVVFALLMGGNAFAEPADDFELIIERQRKVLVGGDHDINDENVKLVVQNREQQGKNAWETMIKAPGRTLLWEGQLLDKYTTGAGIHTSFANLYNMARAYKMKGSELYHNEELKKDIMDGLDFLNRTIYFKGDPYGRTGQLNWFYWEIGIPQSVMDTLCMMYDEMDEDLRVRLVEACLHYAPKAMYAGFSADTLATGSNLIWKCSNHILAGALLKNADMIEEGKAGLDTSFIYVDEEELQEGYRTDGSLTMHPMFPYAGGYGKDGYANIVQLFSLLDGSEFAFGEKQSEMVYDWAFNTYVPQVYKCAMFEGARGRYVARENATAITSGLDVLRTLFKLSVNAPPDKKMKLQSIIKQNVSASEEFKKSFLKPMSIDLVTEAAKMLEDDSIQPMEYGQEAKYFAGMDVLTYKTEDFWFGLRMFSDRVGAYESINDENMHGWYQGHGATYIYNNDMKHYTDNYWCTVDPYKLAGITVSDIKRDDAYRTGYYSSKNWVGGVTLDSEFAFCGMDYEDYKTELDNKVMNAKKSWFAIDGQIISLGCGITNKNETADNNTFVENRAISKTDKIYADGREYGFGDTVSGNMDYIFYQGEKDSIGYCFLNNDSVKLTSLDCSGAWVDIRSSDGRKDIITKPYMQISIPHGVKPENDTYAYVILPGRTHEEVAEYSANPSTVVLENSPAATGVRNEACGVTAVNFWSDTRYSLGGITSYGKACVGTREKYGELYVAISDPTQKQEEMIIELDAKIDDIIYLDEDVEILSTEPVIKLRLNVHESLGYTFNCIFSLAGEEEEIKPPYSLKNKNLTAVKEGRSVSYVNGVFTEKSAPVYCGSNLMMNISFFSEVFGGEMKLDERSGNISVKTFAGEGKFSPGGETAEINGKAVPAAYVENGNVYLPLRAVLELLYNKNVLYDEGLVVITPKEYVADEAICEYLKIRLD